MDPNSENILTDSLVDDLGEAGKEASDEQDRRTENDQLMLIVPLRDKKVRRLLQ